MSNQLENQYTRKHYLVYLIIVILILIACQLPNKLAETVVPLIGAATENVNPPPTAIKPAEAQTKPALTTPSPYPEQQISVLPASSSLAPSQTNTPENIEYPIVETSPATLATTLSENIPYPQQVISTSLDGDESSAYPGTDIAQSPTLITEAYPEVESAQISPSPTIGTQQVPYPQLTLQFTISAPTFLPTVPSIITLTATPTQFFLPPTPHLNRFKHTFSDANTHIDVYSNAYQDTSSGTTLVECPYSSE